MVSIPMKFLVLSPFLLKKQIKLLHLYIFIHLNKCLYILYLTIIFQKLYKTNTFDNQSS